MNISELPELFPLEPYGIVWPYTGTHKVYVPVVHVRTAYMHTGTCILVHAYMHTCTHHRESRCNASGVGNTRARAAQAASGRVFVPQKFLCGLLLRS